MAGGTSRDQHIPSQWGDVRYYVDALSPETLITLSGARMLDIEVSDREKSFVRGLYQTLARGRVPGLDSTLLELTMEELPRPAQRHVNDAEVGLCHPSFIQLFLPDTSRMVYKQCRIEKVDGEYDFDSEKKERGLRNPDDYEDPEMAQRVQAAMNTHARASGRAPRVKEADQAKYDTKKNWSGGYGESGSLREVIDSMVDMVEQGILGVRREDMVFCDVGVGSTCCVQLQVYRRTKLDKLSLKTPVTE